MIGIGMPITQSSNERMASSNFLFQTQAQSEPFPSGGVGRAVQDALHGERGATELGEPIGGHASDLDLAEDAIENELLCVTAEDRIFEHEGSGFALGGAPKNRSLRGAEVFDAFAAV